MKLNCPPTFPVNPLLWISKVTVSADKRHRQAAFQPKHCLSVLNIMHLAPKTAPSGRVLNKTAPVGPANDFTNRLFPLIHKFPIHISDFCINNKYDIKKTSSCAHTYRMREVRKYRGVFELLSGFLSIFAGRKSDLSHN